MIAPVPFVPHRFRSVAEHYLVGRPPYAAGMVRDVAALLGLDGTGRMLDLGCGPGQLAAAFRPHVAEAIGMDPEPEMLALARRHAPGIPFIQGSSADIGPELGTLRLVTIGRAFHWMDRVETLRRLDGLIEPGGAVVLVSTQHLDVPDNAWQHRCTAAVDAAVGGPRAPGRQPGWVRHEAVLLDSPFSDLHRIGVVQRHRTPVADYLHRSLSMSSSSRERLGDGADRLRDTIAGILDAQAEGGTVPEVVETIALIARRP